MKKNSTKGMTAFLILAVSLVSADTFTHLSTGDSFIGFRTHKKSGEKVLIFNADINKFIPLDLTEYQITTDEKGRRDSIMIVKLDQPEILLSEAVSNAVAEAILKAADQGPKALIIQIDSPGGQGPYMRIVAEAITTVIDSTGCRVAAYLPGGRYSGAFSAAAIIALACQQIYIAPTASIGAIGPVVSGAMPTEEYTQFLETFSPDTLSTYSIYAVTLAQKQSRPELLARALIDKQLSIAEVRDVDGRQSLIEVSQRRDNQSVIRMITEGLSGTASESGSPGSAYGGYGKLLSLPSAEAIQWKMADKQALSLREVMDDLKLGTSQIVNVSGNLDKTIQGFAAARRNLDQLIKKIQLEEDRVATLEEHLAEMEKIALTSTVTREVNRGGQYENYRRGTIRLRTSDNLWDRYYNERDYSSDDIPLQDRYGRDIRVRDREGFTDRERITREQPSGNIPEVRMEIMVILTEMVGDYQRAIGLARRWPGALPPGISLDTLQKNTNSAQALYASIQRRAMQGY